MQEFEGRAKELDVLVKDRRRRLGCQQVEAIERKSEQGKTVGAASMMILEQTGKACRIRQHQFSRHAS